MSALSKLRDVGPDAFAAKYGQPSEWLMEAICELDAKVDALSARMPRSVITDDESHPEDYEAQDAEAQRIRMELRQ